MTIQPQTPQWTISRAALTEAREGADRILAWLDRVPDMKNREAWETLKEVGNLALGSMGLVLFYPSIMRRLYGKHPASLYLYLQIMVGKKTGDDLWYPETFRQINTGTVYGLCWLLAHGKKEQLGQFVRAQKPFFDIRGQAFSLDGKKYELGHYVYQQCADMLIGWEAWPPLKQFAAALHEHHPEMREWIEGRIARQWWRHSVMYWEHYNAMEADCSMAEQLAEDWVSVPGSLGEFRAFFQAIEEREDRLRQDVHFARMCGRKEKQPEPGEIQASRELHSRFMIDLAAGAFEEAFRRKDFQYILFHVTVETPKEKHEKEQSLCAPMLAAFLKAMGRICRTSPELFVEFAGQACSVRGRRKESTQGLLKKVLPVATFWLGTADDRQNLERLVSLPCPQSRNLKGRFAQGQAVVPVFRAPAP
ncbi:MAG: hypothetical protein M3O22_03675 [Pseudomonadota bacterium]|nr:hypothetical protein [Pseudomonadota bacterium]